MVIFIMTSCGGTDLPLSYGTLDDDPDYSLETDSGSTELPFFASALCAVAGDVLDGSSIDPESVKAAASYDLKNTQVKYSYEANTRLAPASLTKIMTALLVLEHCEDLNEVITVGDVTIKEEGAQLFKLKEGDRITLRNLLHILLIYSGNDAALALAQYVCEDVDTFVALMNQRAKELGATNTHFVNPHGLHNDDHYTTAYDLYLMFNAAAKHQEFLDTISITKEKIEYSHGDGVDASKTITSTNRFLTGDLGLSEDITMFGGKTGSTSAAGKCIILYTNNAQGDPYITVVMGAGTTDGLYETAKQLMEDTE